MSEEKGKRRLRRGAHRKVDCEFVGAWIPKELMALFDEFVASEDSDRSKVLRKALEEKLRNRQEMATV